MLYPNIHSFRGGELLILAASAIAPFGNLFQQRARKKVSSESIMFLRSMISAAVIFLLIIIIRPDFSYTGLKSSWIILLINGILLLGLSKILWIEGIHRISVMKANALNSISPLLTLIFAWVFLQNFPTIWQILSFIPISLFFLTA